MKNQILLVDDEKDIRDVLCVSLSDMGYQVFEAENGEEAFRIFCEKQAPIVLTDIKMPSMGGIDLLQRIKHENPETEVIMITGHGDMDLAVKSLKCEATDFITKPIDVDALKISLQRARDKIRMRQKLKEYTENLEKLVREKTELQDHLSTLGLMISSISHSIKGLLTGLDGGIYFLRSGLEKKDHDQIKEGWEVIKLMTEHIREMVLDILFYAKERDLKREQVHVLSFAEEVAKVVEPKIANHGFEFQKGFDSNLDQIKIDTGHVKSALINIIENAIDSCSKDRKKASHKIQFEVKQNSDFVIFDIADDGVGMSGETKERLFTPFYSTKGDKGTGLGLFVSNKIIEQHGGEIIVTSIQGKGALFQIKIPKDSSLL